MLNLIRLNSQSLKTIWLLLIFVSFTLSGCSEGNNIEQSPNNPPSAISQEKFQIGTDLDMAVLQPLSEAYRKETGVLIEWVAVDKSVFSVSFDEEPPLHVDIKLPKEVDMLMMHSAYTLANASASHVLQPIGSELLNSTVPSHYQDPKGEWFGVGKYARSIVYNRNKVNEKELVNYAGLGANKWFGRLCMTDIYSPENQAIAKMMMSYNGTKLTPQILANWQTNMGRPLGSDAEILTHIEQGSCDVGIVDSDTFWHYAKTHRNTQIRLMWPNQINRGAITNAITIGMVNSGEEVGQALRFMEWLVSDRGQALLAYYTSTFPVRDIKDETVNIEAIRPEWTHFEADMTPLIDIIKDHRKIEPAQPENKVLADQNNDAQNVE